jgi:hypothetical protein
VGRISVLFAALLAGCTSIPAEPVPLVGEWGGVHVGLKLDPGGGTLDYDCAHGTIGPVLVSPGGAVSAQGTHTPEHGGPVREDEILPVYRTWYSGQVRGDRMILQGRVENGVLLGPFELRRGAEPQILRCY